MISSTKKLFAQMGKLAHEVEELKKSLDRLEQHQTLTIPVLWVPPKPFVYGEHVGYYPDWSTRGTVWRGIVIPRPAGYPAVSQRSGGVLTYVVRDDTRAIRGCFASNLVRV